MSLKLAAFGSDPLYHGISFSVRDDGCGFDPDAAPGPGQGHFGLQGIRERIRDFCGEMSVMSSRERGTKVTVKMKPTMEQ